MRRYRQVRTAQNKQALDRGNWSGETQRPYVSRVLGGGEFLTREVYFDRAFEGPPDFDWDMIIIDGWTVPPAATVGIANWIIDDFGAYIGCRIWIKIPCDGCPPFPAECSEPMLTGVNILRDPGFENHLTLTPTGPDGEVFAGEITVGAPAWPLSWAGIGTLAGAAVADSTGWGVFSNNGVGYYDGYRWGISTINPRSGASHARFHHRTLVGAQDALDLIPIGLRLCPPKVGPSGYPDGVFSAKVVPGTNVRFSMYGAVSDLTDEWWSQIGFEVWSDSLVGQIYEDYTYATPTTTDYVKYEHSLVIPANGVYLSAHFQMFNNSISSVDAFIDADDAELEIWLP